MAKRALRLILLFAVASVTVGPSPLRAQLYMLETEHLRLLYSKAPHGFIAPHAARCFENSLAFHMDLFDWTPSDKITVVLHDQSDFANAGATTSPRNAIIICIAPFSYVYETTPANERMNLIMSHELVHIAAADRAAGADGFFRTIFGGKVRETSEQPITMFYAYMTTPRRGAPRWYHEGIAVFLETWMSGGLGRAQGAYDEMVFRAKVRDSAGFYDPVGVESKATKVDFQGGVNSYLYGTRFMSYLTYEYGPESLVEWVGRSKGSRRYFASQFKKVFGISLDDAWDDWVAWEIAYQTENLDKVRQYTPTYVRDISDHGLGSVSRAFYDSVSHKIYAAVNHPGRIAHIAAIDMETGEMERLCDVKGEAMYYVTAMTWDPDSRTLFYSTDNYEWRDLRCINVDTRESRTLQKDVRMGDLAYNRADSSVWGVRHYNGVSTLTRVAHPYDDWDQVHSWPYGTDMYDLDISPDGQRLTASLAHVNGQQKLILMYPDSLMQKNPVHSELFDFGYSNPESFVFSADGRYAYGSSYYTGVSNIFRYDFAADSMDAVSNAEDGYFRPMPAGDDSLIVLRYTGDGFVPAVVPNEPLEDVSPTRFLGQMIAEKYPQVHDWKIAPPSSVNLDTLVIDSGAYRPVANMRLTSIYPVVEGYRRYMAWGLRADIADPILTHMTDLTVTYSANASLGTNERWHVKWNWKHRGWDFGLRHNGTDFYDLFGPTRRSRKGNAITLGYRKSLLFDPPRTFEYGISLAGYKDLEELPFYQDVPTSYDKFATFGFDVSYGNKRASMGAADYTKGIGWQLINNNQLVKDRIYAQLVNNLDLGLPLPIKHTSIWLRTSAGYSAGSREDPQANLFFGGFQNNYVDYRTETRYRKFYTFPGVPISSIYGTNYVKAQLEFILPPLRFGHAGTSSFYAERIRSSLFATGISTNIDDAALRQNVGNLGAQLDFRFILISNLRMTFSVGYAAAFQKQRQYSDEFMWSLKIL